MSKIFLEALINPNKKTMTALSTGQMEIQGWICYGDHPPNEAPETEGQLWAKGEFSVWFNMITGLTVSDTQESLDTIIFDWC